MISHSGRFVISYNGEIYNHLDIRSKIESEKEVLWKSTCDTETLLEAIELFGMDMALNLLRECLHLHYGTIRKKIISSER